MHLVLRSAKLTAFSAQVASYVDYGAKGNEFRQSGFARLFQALCWRVWDLHRWPIYLADEDRQGDWPWDFGANGAGVKITSRDPMGATGSILLSGRVGC